MKVLGTALTNIRRTPYQSLSAILIIAITFLVAYSFSFFLYTSRIILNHFQTQPQAIAFFQLGATDQEVKAVQDEISSKDYTRQVAVVSQAEALKLYQQTNQDDPMLLELVSADILPASIEVSGADLESLAKIKSDLESFDQIEEVVLQQNIVDALKSSIQKLQLVGWGSIAILSLTSFLTILVITGMKVAHKRHGIYVMKILGASAWFIRSPFVMEGVFYGLFGSLIGWLIMFTSLLYLTPWLKDFVGPIPLFPIPMEAFAIQLGVGTGVGILLAAFASSLAVTRMMRR